MRKAAQFAAIVRIADNPLGPFPTLLPSPFVRVETTALRQSVSQDPSNRRSRQRARLEV